MDEYGFERPEDFDYETYEAFMSEYLTILAKRARKWSELTGTGKSIKRTSTIKRYVRKGIPNAHRAKVCHTFNFGYNLLIKNCISFRICIRIFKLIVFILAN